MSTGKNALSQAEIDAMLNEFEQRLETLRNAYERYFNGIDKRPPELMRKDVVRSLHELEHKVFIRNTAQKFRLQSLSQRFTSYKSNYWDRVLRQIEEGTYERDRNKARRMMLQAQAQEAGAQREQQGPIELDIELDALDSLDDFARDLELAYGQRAHSVPPAQQPAPPPQAIPQPQQPQPSHYAMRETAAAIPSVAALAIQQQRAAQAQQAQAQAQAPQPQPAPQQSASAPSEAELRAKKIMELQAKLGLPTTGVTNTPAPQPSPQPVDSDEARRQKLAAMRQKLQQNQPSSPNNNGSHSQPQPPQRQQPAPSAASSADDERARQVYKNLIEARRRCNEPTDNLSFDQLARSLQQQRERLRQTHNAQDVDFKVVIKDGKAFVKPEPKF